MRSGLQSLALQDVVPPRGDGTHGGRGWHRTDARGGGLTHAGLET